MSSQQYTITVKEIFYFENAIIDKLKINFAVIGDMDKTIITDNQSIENLPLIEALQLFLNVFV